MENQIGNPEEEAAAAYRRLYQTVRTLRAPGGCPWDREQTPLTLRQTLIEEAFEAVDALTQEDSAHAMEELGDVLLNATMTGYMFEQKGDWSVADLINALCDKLIRRHPHVFPQSEGASCMTDASTSEKVLAQWDKIKAEVKGRSEFFLDQVPKSFPPMLKALKFQKKAAKHGMSLPSAEESAGKIRQILSSAEMDENAAGQMLFSVINLLRQKGIDANVALSRANEQFYRETRESAARRQEPPR